MFSFRTFLSFLLLALLGGEYVSAQTNQAISQQPLQTKQNPTPHIPVQQGIVQQQQIQVQPIKSPILGTQNNPAVDPQNPNQPASAQPIPPNATMGQQYVNQQHYVNVPLANQPPVNQPLPNQQNINQLPVRVATQQPITLYGQGNNYRSPAAGAMVIQDPPQNVHPRAAAPLNQVVPYLLNPVEQQELDEFLVRWEKYSAGVKRYDVDFNLFIYNAAIPGADPSKPYKVAYGFFKYIANPRRFVYVVEGEWQGEKQIKRDGDKNPQIFAEKIIIDERSVCKYDYNSKTVHQVNVPPELIGKGIADSPLPLIFGARANELKRRFSMKVVNQGELLRLYARPLLPEDQQEFKELEILLHKQNLTARGLKQWSTSDKEYNVYDLTSPKVNDRLSFVADDLKSWFAKTIDRDWKYEVTNWETVPSRTPAVTQPPVAQPQQTRNEIPLYQAQ